MTNPLWKVIVSVGMLLALSGGCGTTSPKPTARGLPEPEKGIPDEQAAALSRLRTASRTPVVVRFSDRRLRFASFDVEAPGGKGDSPAQQAMAFLERHADLFGLVTPRETLYVSRLVRNAGGDHVFFDQHAGPVAVFGAQLAVHLRGSRVIAVNGDYVPGTLPAAEPALTAESAVALALQHAGPGSRLTGAARLNYFDWRMLYDPSPEKGKARLRRNAETRLAWRLTVVERGSSSGWDYFVDAVSGAVLTRLPTDRHQAPRKDYLIRTLNNMGELLFCDFVSPTDWFTEAGPVSGTTPDAEGIAADLSTNVIYDFFYNNFGFRSWNGNDAQVRFNLDDFDQAFNAAYSPICNHFVFGNNMASRDVMAHEFTHGVTRNLVGFLSSYEPGALNESYADIFAALIETSNWTLGEGTLAAFVLNQGNVIRSLINPPIRSDSLTVDCGPLPFGTGCILPGGSGPFTFAHPDRMSALIRTATNDSMGDFGAIHVNPGVTNKAAFLIAAGGTHNGVTTVAIGRAKTAQLYFEVLTSFLTPNANFQSAADATILLAQAMALSGRNGFTVQDACAVNNSFAAVELSLVDNDCDGVADVTDPDDDGDSVSDSTDNCPRTANPGQADGDSDGAGDACDADADNDGVANAVDNCPTVANVNQRNSDQQNDMGDACDDSDADGVKDATDNCLWHPNFNQKNTDGDAWGNACDRDFDGDGVCQLVGFGSIPPDTGVPPGGCPVAFDNCPLAPNQDQADTDGDGAGNACDGCPNDADTGIDLDGDGIDNACDLDDDGDGVADAMDNCPSVKNIDQLDFNGNGLGTACDPKEQVAVDPGESRPFDLSILRRLERNQVVELKLVPSLEEPGLCGWPSSGRAVQVSVNASFPFVAGVVDDTGRFAGHMEGPREGMMEFVPSADLCAPQVPRSGESISLRGAFRGRSYTLRILPRSPPPLESRLRVDIRVIERPVVSLPTEKHPVR
jgi:Zn-dependent metalloprotease